MYTNITNLFLVISALNDWVKEIKDCIEMKVLYYESESELQVEKEL